VTNEFDRCDHCNRLASACNNRQKCDAHRAAIIAECERIERQHEENLKRYGPGFNDWKSHDI
jgi:hypothetical protein